MSESQPPDDFPHQVHYGPRTPTVRPANGMEGCLCVTLGQGYFLRVKDALNYNDDYESVSTLAHEWATRYTRSCARI
jgi:hypothetical protein